jgi:hypothetical protein
MKDSTPRTGSQDQPTTNQSEGNPNNATSPLSPRRLVGSRGGVVDAGFSRPVLDQRYAAGYREDCEVEAQGGHAGARNDQNLAPAKIPSSDRIAGIHRTLTRSPNVMAARTLSALITTTHRASRYAVPST